MITTNMKELSLWKKFTKNLMIEKLNQTKVDWIKKELKKKLKNKEISEVRWNKETSTSIIYQFSLYEK